MKEDAAPETRTAVLMCGREGKPTRHVYVGSTRWETPESDPSPFWRMQFRCVCGEVRTWGVSEERPPELYQPGAEART